MPPKHVWVREEDLDLWNRADAWAKARRVPMSGLIILALQAWLEAHGDDAP
jgi:hypothetical protein